MPKKQNKQTLGKALQRQQERKTLEGRAKVKQQGQFYHESKEVKENYQIQQENLQSIIDQDALNEYLQMAEMANIKYEADKMQKVVTSTEQKQVIINVNSIRSGQMKDNNVYDIQRNKLMVDLTIPRRPKWDEKTTVDKLREMENQNFIQWRKELARFEEEHYQIHLTPYEKNIEVWKQLWRVVEKSDILVQVVDGRDILFYHCNDLLKYVNEEQNRVYHKNETKQNFLLINKSDLLSLEIRTIWSNYLKSLNINHMFFSAKLEQEKIDKEDDQQEEEWEDVIGDQEQDKKQIEQSDIINNVNKEQKEQKQLQQQQKQQKLQQKEIPEKHQAQSQSIINTPNIADRKLLLSELKYLVTSIREERKIHKDTEHNQVTIGMVGYPNVGKSSVINALCNRKLVGVGCRPGKTKHFQTIQLESSLVLCDCPGLIFPNASSTRAEMVCNGVLPIDNIKDYLSPIDLLCERIPKIVLEKLYGVTIEKANATSFLGAYGMKRGFMTGRGLPDEAKCAKLVLKDFVNGRLLYCKVPPECKEKVWQSNSLEHLDELLKKEAEKLVKPIDQDFDDQFETQMVKEKKLTNDEILDIFNQNDLFQLMEGKRVHGIKLTKEQRREIKFQYQRGEQIDFKKYINFNTDQKQTVYIRQMNTLK